jgi:RNA polymerase sigma factor (sigma-70 family)
MNKGEGQPQDFSSSFLQPSDLGRTFSGTGNRQPQMTIRIKELKVMKIKLYEAAEQTDEIDHTHINKPAVKALGKHDFAPIEKCSQIVDNQEIDALVEQLRKDWANSDFVKLVNDEVLMKQLEKICEEVTRGFRRSLSYSPDDLKMDVIERLAKALPHYRQDGNIRSWLRGIAFNRMVDLYRRPNNKALAIEGTKIQGKDGEQYELDGEGVETGEFVTRFVETHRNRVEDQRVRSILLDELMGTLSHQERSLCFKYFIKGLTMQEIADEERRTRQAVSHQFGRIMQRLRKTLD